MAVSHLRNTPITGKSYTTSADATDGQRRWFAVPVKGVAT